MAVLQMQRMNLVAMKQNRKAILERLQEIGSLEIDVKAEDYAGTMQLDTAGMRAVFEKRAASADRALAILDEYVPEEKGLLSSFAGKPLVDCSELDEVIGKQQEYLAQIASVLSYEKQIGEDRATIQKLENQLEMLMPWKALDIPMNVSGTDKTTLLIGTIPEQVTEEIVLTALKTHQPPVDAAEVEIIKVERDATYLSVLCLKQDGAGAEEALREMGFAKPSWQLERVPNEEQAALNEQIKACQLDIEANTARIAVFADSRKYFRLVSDYFRMRADKYVVLGELPQTANTFAISGYIPAYLAQSVADELSEKYQAVVELEELPETEEAPVLLKNNSFSEAVEGVLESYGLPKKGEIDPTVAMSIFYVFLFGMMLSDAAYGVIMAVGCGVALKKFPNMEKGLRKSLKMFFFCGLSTVFWGVMFGSYFGDLVNVVSKNWFGHEVSIPAVWFDPISEPMRLLVFAMLFGVIHMFVGQAIKGYTMIKQGDVLGAIWDVLAWYMLLIGLILMLLPTSIFESISGMQFVFPNAVNTLAKVLTIAGALIIFVMSGRSKGRQIGLRLALGAYDLYGITSWLSDLLSYSRLLALGLATGVIAQVINQMGAMFGTGIFGTIGFILVFSVGTVLNLAINLLGAYVHSNRLEYVEFFGKFYEGGGRAFTPFQRITKYVNIVHDSRS